MDFLLAPFVRPPALYILPLLSVSLEIGCNPPIIPTTISPIKSPSNQKKLMQKYCNTLKFMWKELDTKLLDNFRKCLKTQHWRFE